MNQDATSTFQSPKNTGELKRLPILISLMIGVNIAFPQLMIELNVSASTLQWLATGCTLVCGIAPHFSILLVGRLLQAAGTGLMLPVLMNTILVLYPPDKRGAAMGSIGLVIMFAPAIGPTLSGLILESLQWRWLFYLVLPFAAFSIVFAAIYLKNVSETKKIKVDVLSLILSTIGFGAVVDGFSSSGEGHGGWSNPLVYGTVSS